MYSDPFFRARAKGHTPYMDDVNQTYKKLPKRNQKAFDAAMLYREREKAKMYAMAEENEYLRNKLSSLALQTTDVLKQQQDRLIKQQSNIEQLNSKLKTATDGSRARITSSDGVDGALPALGSSTESGEGRTIDVSGAVLQPDVPDTRGQADEHTDEGRQSDGDAPAAATEEPEA